MRRRAGSRLRLSCATGAHVGGPEPPAQRGKSPPRRRTTTPFPRRPARVNPCCAATADTSCGWTSYPSALQPIGPQSEQSFELDRPLREARDAFEKCYFECHLAKENGSMTRVAEKTGLERTHLYRKLKQLGVDLARNNRTGRCA